MSALQTEKATKKVQAVC